VPLRLRGYIDYLLLIEKGGFITAPYPKSFWDAVNMVGVKVGG
jgi:hypothetical protein